MKINYFLAALSLAVLVTSCSKDDDKNDVDGVYKLTAFNSPEAFDFNGDGRKSINLLDEVDCLKNASVTLKGDGNYIAIANGLDLSADIVVCTPESTDEGKWSINGNQLTFTSNDATEDVEILTVDGNKLILRENSTTTVIDENTGEPVQVNVNVELIFTKQ
jgi:Lipocalin-like domain